MDKPDGIYGAEGDDWKYEIKNGVPVAAIRADGKRIAVSADDDNPAYGAILGQFQRGVIKPMGGETAGAPQHEYRSRIATRMIDKLDPPDEVKEVAIPKMGAPKKIAIDRDGDTINIRMMTEDGGSWTLAPDSRQYEFLKGMFDQPESRMATRKSFTGQAEDAIDKAMSGEDS